MGERPKRVSMGDAAVKLGKLARPTTEVGSSPTVCLGSPEPQREEEEGSDGGTRPSVTARKGGERAQRTRGPSVSRPACVLSSWAARGTVSFSFSFCAKFILCLILYSKSCADPKIMEIFV